MFPKTPGTLCTKRTNLKRQMKAYVSDRAIYTRRVKRQYGICWLKKELSMVHGTHGLRMPREEIAFTARPKIQSQSQIFRYG